MNALDALKQVTTVVADTGSFALMRAFAPQDATTNPSLILKAATDPQYAELLGHVRGKADAVDRLLVAFGVEILKIIPGRVSTEVDARLSFDTQATIAHAHSLIDLYAAQGIAADRVLIKIAATWEGIRAAQVLENQGIACNLTLLFSQVQAQACAEAAVTLISPFVGRITDWHKARGAVWSSVEQDPGVLFVRTVYGGYQSRGVQTEVMGASFRSAAQVLALAGCDLLTVSPELLAELQSLPSTSASPREQTSAPPLTPRKIGPRLPGRARALRGPGEGLGESDFRFGLNEDAMATEKLAEGIRSFARDGQKLRDLVRA
ncbi:MAG: transaldolase [Betaproteobacteria bacterium]|nr:transaldolase [Betaproteobacteria bacterium]